MAQSGGRPRRECVRGAAFVVAVMTALVSSFARPARADLPRPTHARVAVGDGEACAAMPSGAVLCWSLATLVPTRVAGVDDAIQVAMGGRHRCVLRASGAVVCWGSNDVGQLGDGTRAPRPGAMVAVRGIDDAVEVSATDDRTCARSASGHVACWGLPYGLDPRWNEVEDPVLGATEIAGVHDAVSIAVGAASGCAVCASGEVLCWREHRGAPDSRPAVTALLGVNDARQVSLTGVGYVRDANLADRDAHGVLANVTAVAGHGCVSRATGEVSCWGVDALGQLGDGTRRRGRVSVPVQADGVVGATMVAAGGVHTCATGTDRRLWCWGLLGRADTFARRSRDGVATRAASVMVPVRASELGIPGAVDVAVGATATCATRPDRRLVCWGMSWGPDEIELPER